MNTCDGHIQVSVTRYTRCGSVTPSHYCTNGDGTVSSNGEETYENQLARILQEVDPDTRQLVEHMHDVNRQMMSTYLKMVYTQRGVVVLTGINIALLVLNIIGWIT